MATSRAAAPFKQICPGLPAMAYVSNRAIVNVQYRYLLELEYACGAHQGLVNADRAHVVEIGVCYDGAMYLR